MKDGEPTDTLCLNVDVRKKYPPAQVHEHFVVPKQFDGVPTNVEEVGEIELSCPRVSCFHPTPGEPDLWVQGGISISHHEGDSGTLGCKLQKNNGNSDEYILSCNHVIVLNNSRTAKDYVTQPGKNPDLGFHDTNNPTTHPGNDCDAGTDRCIAELSEFLAIKTVRTYAPTLAPGAAASTAVFPQGFNWNTVLANNVLTPNDNNHFDAAIAKIFPDRRSVKKMIYEIAGAPTGNKEATLRMKVQKSGRTTDVTDGTVVSKTYDYTMKWSSASWTNPATGTVAGNFVDWAHFKDQIKIKGRRGNFSQQGDSGAVVLEKGSKKVVGLLFAITGAHSVANHIKPILTHFDVHIMT